MDWANIPTELLNLVLSNLLPYERETFGLVCRSWKACVTRNPWLMFYQSSKRSWNFIQSNGDVYNNKELPGILNAEISCSKYGWLLMSRDNGLLFFFDPYNKMKIEVPRMDDFYTTICFFHPPTSPDCFIFGITNVADDDTTFHIGILKRGEGKWKSNQYISNSSFVSSVCTPVLHRKFIYCLDVDGRIGRFNMRQQFSRTSSWKVYNPEWICDTMQHFLFKIQGKKTLFAVFVVHEERKVNVFRFMERDMKWELVEDLGDKMLYVSHSASFATIAPLKSMANRIYFPMFHGDKGVFYSLKTKNYHSFEGDYVKPNSYGLKEFNFATWYTPLPTQAMASKVMPWHP